MRKPKTHWHKGCRIGIGSHTVKIHYNALAFVESSKTNPDWYCVPCATKARLALAKEPAPKPSSRCTRQGCGSHAINPSQCGRDDTSDLDLCDMCYWRKRAESVVWPKPRPIAEAPRTTILAWFPGTDMFNEGWEIVFPSDEGWITGREGHQPTHFLPLPPEVR